MPEAGGISASQSTRGGLGNPIQGRVSLQPPPLAALHTVSGRKTLGALFTCEVGWAGRPMCRPLGSSVKETDSLCQATFCLDWPEEALNCREVCNTFTRDKRSQEGHAFIWSQR